MTSPEDLQSFKKQQIDIMEESIRKINEANMKDLLKLLEYTQAINTTTTQQSQELIQTFRDKSDVKERLEEIKRKVDFFEYGLQLMINKETKNGAYPIEFILMPLDNLLNIPYAFSTMHDKKGREVMFKEVFTKFTNGKNGIIENDIKNYILNNYPLRYFNITDQNGQLYLSAKNSDHKQHFEEIKAELSKIKIQNKESEYNNWFELIEVSVKKIQEKQENILSNRDFDITKILGSDSLSTKLLTILKSIKTEIDLSKLTEILINRGT